MRYLSVACLMLITSAAVAEERQGASRPLALVHISVIDTAGGPTLADRTVLITGDRIASVAKRSEAKVPEGAQVVDGSGKFLIPGLWDMHVHMAGKEYLKLFVANGVTGVRDMHAFYPERILGWRKEVAEGKTLGPQIVAAAALVDGAKPFWLGSLIATNEEEGRQAVRALKKRGADFIKVYSKLTPEAFHGIADEAKKEGMPFVGHVPELVSAAEASDAGQKSMEHLYGIGTACSRDEQKLRREVMESMNEGDNDALVEAMLRARIREMDSIDPGKAVALFARFVKNGTWQVPTLTLLHNVAYLDDERVNGDPRVKYMSGMIRALWDPQSGMMAKQLKSISMAELKRLYQKDVELVGAMHRAGVRFLAGTDTTNPYCFPGFSLHDELAYLVGAGLTPMEALQSATLNPADFLGKEETMGTVSQGKMADLVLLDADPLKDIRNTQRIAAVVRAGKLLDRKALDAMLAEVEKSNRRKSNVKPPEK